MCSTSDDFPKDCVTCSFVLGSRDVPIDFVRNPLDIMGKSTHGETHHKKDVSDLVMCSFFFDFAKKSGELWRCHVCIICGLVQSGVRRAAVGRGARHGDSREAVLHFSGTIFPS